MTREIKFRLTLHGDIVGYEKWYPGAKNDETGAWSALPKWLYSADGKRWNPKAIIHNGKEECIDIKDKNDIEIYESDLVKYTDDDGSEIIGRVEMFRCQWGLMGDGAFSAFEHQIQTSRTDYHEVISNVQEAPA